MQGFKRSSTTVLIIYQSWSALQTLDINYSEISLAAATYLVSCKLPQLRQLDLSFPPLSTQTAAKLSEGKWPQLQDLDLSHSICNADILQHIAVGSWPALTSLNIGRYQQYESRYFQMKDFTATALDPLQGSQWPMLENLSADGWNCIHLSVKDQGCRWPNSSSLTTSHIKPDCQAPSLTRLSLAAVTRPDFLLNALSLHLPVLEQLYVCCCH